MVTDLARGNVAKKLKKASISLRCCRESVILHPNCIELHSEHKLISAYVIPRKIIPCHSDPPEMLQCSERLFSMQN